MVVRLNTFTGCDPGALKSCSAIARQTVRASWRLFHHHRSILVRRTTPCRRVFSCRMAHEGLLEHPGSAAWGRCQRPDVARSIQADYAKEFGWMSHEQIPVVYHEKYNITFGGLERLHPFDSCKFSKVVTYLTGQGIFSRQQVTQAQMVTDSALLDVHTQEYMTAIKTSSAKVAEVTELGPLRFLPNFTVQQRVIVPMRHHVGGTMLAAALALASGWSINIGGGMHHAYHSDGMGWCPFDDIMLAIRRLRKSSGGQVSRVLIIDLDAHQGNGYERDKLHFADNDVMIMDAYNSRVFPADTVAKKAIDINIELQPGTTDVEYLARLQEGLQQVRTSAFDPHLIVYNAGTDVLDGDPLGRLSVSPEGVIQRDEMVFRFALELGVPICMLLSGGYAKNSATVIGKSIENLFKQLQLQ